MSKAFTKEDDRPEAPVLVRLPSASLPPEAKNYLTPAGFRRLREELDRLMEVDRPRLAAARDQHHARRELEAVDLRIRRLQQSLESAVIVAAPSAPCDQVRFGATVTVRNSTGIESCYRIVGVDDWAWKKGPVVAFMLSDSGLATPASFGLILHTDWMGGDFDRSPDSGEYIVSIS